VPPKTNRVTAEQAGRNADAVVAFRAAGLDSLKHCPPDSVAYGKAPGRWKKELARMTVAASQLGVPVKLNIDTLGKMRRVAEEYTEDQVADLAGRVRAHSSRFSTSHLIRLLAVDDRKKRDSLESEALRESWPLSRLQRQVQVTRKARRPGAGRKPAVPEDSKHRLLVLEGLALKWVRWTREVGRRLPAAVRKLVETADGAVGAVLGALEVQRKRKRKKTGGKDGQAAQAAEPGPADRRPATRRPARR
jgi:hypothetical protein